MKVKTVHETSLSFLFHHSEVKVVSIFNKGNGHWVVMGSKQVGFLSRLASAPLTHIEWLYWQEPSPILATTIPNIGNNHWGLALPVKGSLISPKIQGTKIVRTPDPSGHARKGLGKKSSLEVSQALECSCQYWSTMTSSWHLHVHLLVWFPLHHLMMSERTSLQPTSIRLTLMTGSEYSGTPLNRHPSPADTHDLTAKSESPNCPYIHLNT